MESASNGRSRLRAVGVALGVAVLGFLVGIAVSVAVTLAYVSVTNTPVDQIGAVVLLGISLVSLQGIAFPLVAWGYVRRRRAGWSFVPVSMPDLRDLKYVVGGFALAFAGLFVMSILLTFLSVETAENTAGTTALENPGIIPLLIPLQFLLIGPGEELLFRGIIQGSLREQFDAAPAIVLATLMFAPAHILALSGGATAVLATVGVLFVPSLVFGYLYEKTRNIAVPAIAHGLYNATLFGLTYLQATADPQNALLLPF